MRDLEGLAISMRAPPVTRVTLSLSLIPDLLTTRSLGQTHQESYGTGVAGYKKTMKDF